MSDEEITDPIEALAEDAKLELNSVMKEISLELAKIETSRDQIKSIIDAAHSVFNIEKPLIHKVSKLFHKKNMPTYENETSTVKELYAAVTQTN